MRKLLILLTIFLLTFGLAACGSGEQTTDKSPSKPAASSKAEEKTKEQPADAEEQPNDSAATSQTEENTAQAQADSKTNSDTQSASTANATTTKTADTKQQVNNNNTPGKTNPAPSNGQTTASPTQPAAPAPESQKPATTVTFSIIGPDNHVILAATKVNFSEGDTVFDVLKQLDKQHSFVVVSRGSGATTYIEGIEGSDFSYFEFDEGPTSGWVFKQNGANLTKSVGVTALKDGDRIEGIYTK
ncbi:DUF4430 domain-containing protein [Bacillus sp. FJAT-29814]|uniref:DUF4430 domain-containing protein n=1 Tax=Bacillus sp. FJAT-29814 TaxID=1729688 RepID=UPI000835955B|nr:DUF4430 domain-containing protein [Bacillus sp. FJAT-29814]